MAAAHLVVLNLSGYLPTEADGLPQYLNQFLWRSAPHTAATSQLSSFIPIHFLLTPCLLDALQPLGPAQCVAPGT